MEQLAAGLAGQVGYSFKNGQRFTERGIGNPGMGLTGYFVF
jgi:hypothetical protein